MKGFYQKHILTFEFIFNSMSFDIFRNQRITDKSKRRIGSTGITSTGGISPTKFLKKKLGPVKLDPWGQVHRWASKGVVGIHR